MMQCSISQPQRNLVMDYSAIFANWSKMYRDLYNAAHNTLVEEWVKAEQRLTETPKFWKK